MVAEYNQIVQGNDQENVKLEQKNGVIYVANGEVYQVSEQVDQCSRGLDKKSGGFEYVITRIDQRSRERNIGSLEANRGHLKVR